MNWEKIFYLKMLQVPNAPLKSPDVQLFEGNYFFSKRVVFLIFPKAAVDIIMSVEPLVLEVPPGIVGPLKWFSRQEAGQEWDAGAYDSAYESFLSSERTKPYNFPG